MRLIDANALRKKTPDEIKKTQSGVIGKMTPEGRTANAPEV